MGLQDTLPASRGNANLVPAMAMAQKLDGDSVASRATFSRARRRW